MIIAMENTSEKPMALGYSRTASRKVSSCSSAVAALASACCDWPFEPAWAAWLTLGLGFSEAMLVVLEGETVFSDAFSPSRSMAKDKV
jgi:hypothetical protein